MKSHAFSTTGALVLLSALAALFSALPAAGAPSVSWGSYLGGLNEDLSFDAAVDGTGNVYVVGGTNSNGWVSGGWDISLDTSFDFDGFVVKLNASGGHVWSTYLGGDNGRDMCVGVAVNAVGSVFVTGDTETSGWFGGVGAWQAADPGPGRDGFVMKLDSAGAPVWYSYLGGASSDSGTGLALDASGNVYATGRTSSAGWVLSGGWDTQHSGDTDAYLVKLNASGGHEWSTFLGGANNDRAEDVAVDSAGNVYVAGLTATPDWIGPGAWDATLGGSSDGYVVKASPAGAYLWGTYVGGAEADRVWAIAAGPNDTLFAAGYTWSGEWVSGGWDTTHAGDADGFVVRLDMGGTHGWSACFGGQYFDICTDMALSGDNVYVAGTTDSGGWVSGGWATNLVENGSTTSDGFVLRMTVGGAHLWSSYCGGTTAGSGRTSVEGITAGTGGAVYVAGVTREAGWLSGGWNTSGGGTVFTDGYVLKFMDVTVPNLLFMAWADAEAAILAAGLSPGTVSEAHNPSVPAGQVASQDPVAGTLATAGDAVSFVLSLGPAPVLVPDVASLTRANAEAAIAAANLTVGTVSEATSLTVPAGLVISQNPAAGASVPVGTAVSFTVSLGLPSSVTVPNVVGMTQEAAEAAVVAAGLSRGTTTTQYSDTTLRGLISAQVPAAGTSAAPGTVVNLFSSLGPDPDLVADARDSLADDFNDADADNSDTLTLTEAQTVIPALTQLTFNALDTNADGVLGRDELDADNGCGCGGCSCERSAMTIGGLKRRLGDLFLGGLALALLAAMGRRSRP